MSDINVDTPGASGANPTATASDVAVNGSAATFMRSDGAPAVQKTSSSVFGLCKVDNTTITASGGVITAVPGGGGVGNVTGPASSTDTAIATWNGTAGTALRNNSATLIDASGNISTTGKFSATGNVSGGNLTTAGVVSATGNVSGGNLTTAGLVSATGNVSGGNLTTVGNVTGANIGNITPTNLNGNTSTFLNGSGNFTSPPGRLIGIQTITTTGSYTYTPTTGTTSVCIELLGAGGGGSGVASAGVNQVNLGGGGGGGAWLFIRKTSNFSGATGVVGAKGTGGAAGNNNGTDGGNTTFIDTAGSPTTYTASGGLKGTPRTSFAPPITNFGGAGGTATNGTLNIPGADAFAGIAPNQFVGYASGGGSSHYGPYTPNANVVDATSSVGPAGGGKGTGGSGAVSSNAGGNKAGGDGTDGLVIIYEYS